MLAEIWDKIKAFIEKWGDNRLVAGLVLFILGLLARELFPKAWRLLVRFTGWIWANIRGRGADRAFERKYLDWLIGQHRHLGLLPAQVVARRWGERQQFVELEDVYIRLSMSTRGGDEHWAATYGEGESSWRKRPWLGLRLIRYVAQLLPPSEWLEKSSILTEQYYEPGDPGLVVDRHKRLVIRGDPGSGKTTLLRYLAVTCVRALRNNKKDGDSPRLVKKRLLWNTHPFPILVSLSRHSNVASWEENRGLIDIFVEEMPPELRRGCPKGFFERRLRDGNCLILFDAFDELGSPEARGAMAHCIAGLLEVYDRPDNRIVVTTRIIGYEGQLDRYGFHIRTVQNLNAGEIRALVKQRYKAITLSEIAGRQPEEARAIRQRLMRRSESLMDKIESTLRLRQLATNPMLLSLIVLVHFLKVDLPEERILLYRDCVEILTERWQQVKREEIGMKGGEDRELTLSQKLVLLREIAFAMQQRRQEEGSQALIPRDTACDIIADKLPDFLGMELPDFEHARREACRHKAEEWIDGIQVESGILVERGLDQAGEPLVGFSHLTFQEYLSAVALNEVETYQPLLWSNLLNPAWREVVLLHVVLTSDATPIVKALLGSPAQPDGVLLAGYCLAERLKRVETSIQQKTIAQLKQLFSEAEDDRVGDFGKVLTAIGGSDVTAFMRKQINEGSLARRVSAIRALGQTRGDDPEIERVRADLVQILDTASDLEITVTARESLAQIGDPRFTGPEPRMVQIPRHSLGGITSLSALKKLITHPEWRKAGLKQRLELVPRILDYLLFILWRIISRRQTRIYIDSFEISKYPVTNLEYYRFVEATGHKTPKTWKADTFPAEEATHPVVGVSREDADAYCRWLSRQTRIEDDGHLVRRYVDAFCKWLSRHTGKRYRLPTEWEWEVAARGTQGWKYPWGDQFDKDKCNTEESSIEGTTPVGSYRTGNSPYGISDMSGNVWEMSSGFMVYILLVCAGTMGGLALLIALLLSLVSPFDFRLIIIAVCGFSAPAALLFEVITDNDFKTVLRGGSWNAPSNQATCFHRRSYLADVTKYVQFRGFRCVRE